MYIQFEETNVEETKYDEKLCTDFRYSKIKKEHTKTNTNNRNRCQQMCTFSQRSKGSAHF